jgi:type VI secretion system protein ImpH
MDAAHGPAAPALSPIGRAIREYSLFQGVRLALERLHAAHPELDEASLYDRLEFHVNPSLGFPGSDIEEMALFQADGQWHARLRLNLLGLVGAGSPLPAFYADQALGDSVGGNPTRDFLDLFNDRLQRLLLPIWQKYRYHAAFRSGAADPLSAQLFALIGLGGETIRQAQDLNWRRLLPYLGLLSLRAHSAALVESVLRYYFKHVDLHIEQCLERQVDILAEQRSRLGEANNTLGETLVLGERVPDRSGKFRIHVRQLSWARFHEFLPIGAGYRPLCALVRFVLRDPLDYDIRLSLRQPDIRGLSLAADDSCRLGWTTWLGREHADGLVTLTSRLP